MRKFGLIIAAVAALGMSSVAVAAVSFDPAAGTGFVGKGDVQLALGLNNAQVQSASLSFASVSTEVSEVSWECTNANNEKVQERARTTTTTISGVLSSVARVKNQITGYNLNGYASSTPTSTTEGPAVMVFPEDLKAAKLVLKS